MQVAIFGSSGMVGQGVLRECLLDPKVTSIVSVVRTAGARAESKLREIVHSDFQDFSAIEPDLQAVEACFFCLGVTSAGMSEDAYRRVTVGIAAAAVKSLVRVNPAVAFVFVSGAGADSAGTSRLMWSRVKGEAEKIVLRQAANGFVVRPAAIVPRHGIRSRTGIYNAGYAIARPLLPLLQRLLPGQITTTEQLAKVMVSIAKQGAPKRVLESRDIVALSAESTS